MIGPCAGPASWQFSGTTCVVSEVPADAAPQAKHDHASHDRARHGG